MSDFTSVWDDAGDVAEAEVSLRAMTAARVQAAAYWPFLSAATNRDDFVNRLALKDAEIADCAEAQGITFEALVRSLAADFHDLEEERLQATAGGNDHGGTPGRLHPGWGAADEAQLASQHNFPAGTRGILHSKHGNVMDANGRPGFYATVTHSPGDHDGGSTQAVMAHKVAIEGHGGTIHSYHHFGFQANGAPHSDLDSKPMRPAMASRHLAIFKATAADDSTAYYVVDEDTDKKVGGPYDDEAAAKAAISGGDVEGDNLTVSSGGSDSDSDGDSDSDEDDAPKDDSDDSDDSDDGDDKKANPFAKKESSRKLAFGDGPTRDYEPYSHGQDGWKSGVGSYGHGDEDKAVGSAWKPHRVYDSLSSAVNHLVGDERHPDQVSSGLESYNHCPSCDNVYSTNHPEHVTHGSKDQCPNCGDTDFHETAADVHHESRAQDRDMYEQHGHPGEEDNYGDPYGRNDHHMTGAKTETVTMAHPELCGAYVHGGPVCKCGEKTADGQTIKPDPNGPGMKGKQSSLFPIIALQDGEDPLEWVVDSVPSGEGEPEKPDEHNEDLVLTGSLVDQFRQVFTATLRG